MKKYELIHADTCLPDYWPGHHLPHVQIPAYPMTLDEVKTALHSEVWADAVCGVSSWDYESLHDAINELKERDGFTGLHFSDIEQNDSIDTIYAYFVFVPLED